MNAHADNGSTLLLNLDLTLNLQTKACTINNNQNVTVNLGDDILLDEIDGNNYKKILPLNVNCSDTSFQDVLKLTINGTGAGFDPDVLETTTNGLGIKLISSGRQIKIGEPISFSRSIIPDIYAIPIKKDGAKIQGGKFTAAANVKIEYE